MSAVGDPLECRVGAQTRGPTMTPIDWLMSGDTGTSSKTICSVMTGSNAPKHGPDVPHDADDFGRCYRLLRLFPDWRRRLPEVAAKHQEWGPMVAAWDELTALYEANDHDRFWGRIQALEDEGRIAAGWKKTSPNSWSGPGVDVVEIGTPESLLYEDISFVMDGK